MSGQGERGKKKVISWGNEPRRNMGPAPRENRGEERAKKPSVAKPGKKKGTRVLRLRNTLPKKN